MSSLVECFSIIRDPRQASKIDHELIDICKSACKNDPLLGEISIQF